MNAAAVSRGCERAEAALAASLYAIPLTVSWTVAGAHIAAGLAAALALLLVGRWRRWPLARTRADYAFLAFAVAACLAVLFALPPASDPVPLKKLLLVPIVHLAACSLVPPQRATRGLRLYVAAIALTAAVASAIFLLQRHPMGDRLRSTTHYMTLSGLLVLAWPMAAAATCLGPHRRLYGVAAAALTLALVLSLTRGAWLALPVAVVAMLARTRPRWLLLVPLLTLASYFVLPPAYRDRLRTSFDPTYTSNADRLQMWRTGVAMWRDRPLTGVGLGDLQPLYRTYAPAGVERVYGHLHNNWVHVLASMGTLGFLAFGWLMLQCGRIVYAAGATGAAPELRALAIGGWGSFWAFQTMGLFEWNFGDVEVTIAFYFLLGVFAAVERSARR